MRVLLACEWSGVVRDAFNARGHLAVSCDLLPSASPGIHYQGDVRDLLDGWMPVQFTADCDPEGDEWCNTVGKPPSDCDCVGPTQDGVEYKEVGGVLLGRPIDDPTWAMIIAFPPCQYLTIAAEWCYADEQKKKMNPGVLYGAARRQAREDALQFVRDLMDAPCDRIAIENPVGVIGTRIRPYTQQVQPWYFGEDASKKTCLWLKNLPELVPTNILPGGSRARRANQTPSGQNKLGPSADRAKIRGKTYQGIAHAMADQWGEL